jgi:hypothetical protein
MMLLGFPLMAAATVLLLLGPASLVLADVRRQRRLVSVVSPIEASAPTP